MGKATDSVSQTGNGATGVANAFTGSQWSNQNQAQMNQALASLLSGRPGDPLSTQQYFNAGMGSNGMVNFNPQNAQQPNPFMSTRPELMSGFAPMMDSGMQMNAHILRSINPFAPRSIGQTNSQTSQSVPQATFGSAASLANASFQPNQINGQYNAQPQNIQTQVQNPFVNNPSNINTQVQSQFNSPQFQQTNLQGVQTGFQPGMLPQVQSGVPGFQGAQLQNVQPGIVGQNQFMQGPNAMQGFGQQAQLSNITNPEAQRAAMAAIMGNQQQMDIANLRERFGNQGLSSGAALAESNYLAQSNPQMALALDQITRDNNAQALTQRAQDLQNFQGSRGLDVQQLGLGTEQANAFNQFGLNQRGQDIGQNQFGAQVGLSLNDQQLAAAGQQNQFALGANGQNLQAGGMNQQAAIAQMNANLQAMGMSNEAILAMNQQMLGQNNAMNQFNQGNAQFGAQMGMNAQQQSIQNALQQMGMNQQNNQFGANLGAQTQQQSIQNALQQMGMNMQNNQFGATFGQNAQQMNNQFGLNAAQMNQQNQFQNMNAALQNQQQGNQFNLGMQNVGLGMQSNQMQAQIAALTQMMQNLRQTQALGTPQAENVVNQGWLSGIGQLVPNISF